MPDGKSAKKVIKGVLKQHKKGLSIEGLKKDVCKQLEAEGMTAKKAEKAFDAKIQLPIFEVKAGVARLVKNKDGDAAVAELLKRTDEELSALSSRGACPPDVRAHYDATVRHVAHQRERGDAVGARYRDLPET